MKLAVILAAGMGTRLENHSNSQPKGFLKIGAESLIERSIRLLKEHGIERVLIGTGYSREHYNQLATLDSSVSLYHNPAFDKTGSLYTLGNARKIIDEDFLLLESDILYEKNSLKYLLDDNKKDVILTSGQTNSGDEVFIEATDSSKFKFMSKKKDDLTTISGELVGITKMSLKTYQKICKFIDDSFDSNPGLHYEDGINYVSNKIDFFIKKVENLLWCEIDDVHHLKRAKELLYPAIIKKDR